MDKDKSLQPLREWLQQHNAQTLWSVDVQGVGWIQANQINGRILIIQGFEPQAGTWLGWEAYLPVGDNDTQATLEAMTHAVEK